ncbi:MAG: CvpA family protein [Planctomycetes bacterium]|nr:CvpA family protein [Planctomycetota bacterium]
MTVYDGVMALIVLFTVVHGYFRGAAWQVAPILSLVGGYMVAMPMSVTMAHYFGPPPLNRLFALVTIYILVAITVYLMIRTFREGVDKAKLTEVDRHIGALLGGVKGILATLVATCALLIYFPQMREVILQSESSSIASKIIGTIYPILPNAMHQILDPYLKKLEEQIPIDMQDGFQGSNATPATPSRPVQPASQPESSGDGLQLTPTASTPDFAPRATARRPLRSAPVSLEPSDPDEFQPQPKSPSRPRPVVRSAQEDDPFEAADPDRALSPLR